MEGEPTSNMSFRSMIEGFSVHIGRPSDSEPYELEITGEDTNINLNLGEVTAEDGNNLLNELKKIIPESMEGDQIDINKLKVGITRFLNPQG